MADGDPDDAPVDEHDEVDRLRAERDALAQEVAALQARPRSRVRQVAVGILVLLSWIALALAPVAVWARAQVLETDRWVAVAAPLSAEPAVQAALADWATDELDQLVQPENLLRRALPERADPLSIPLAGAVTDFIHDRVTAYLATDEFSQLWEKAVVRAHAAALRLLEGDAPNVTAGADSVTINLLPLLQRVLDRITSASPELFGREISLPEIDLDDIPTGAAQGLGEALGVEVPDDLGQITVYDRGRLRAAQGGLRILGRLVTLIVVVAVIAPLAALWLSDRRRHTTTLVVAGAVVALILVRRGLLLFEDAVTSRITRAPARGVADRLLERLLAPLFEATGWIVAVGLLLLAILFVSGPRPSAVRLRRSVVSLGRTVAGMASTGMATAPAPAVRWVSDHRGPLQVGVVAVAVAALWIVDLGWLATLVLIAATAGAAVLIGRVGDRPPPHVQP